jgi:hypothetical protein
MWLLQLQSRRLKLQLFPPARIHCKTALVLASSSEFPIPQTIKPGATLTAVLPHCFPSKFATTEQLLPQLFNANKLAVSFELCPPTTPALKLLLPYAIAP